jgi:hypothetical protein
VGPVVAEFKHKSAVARPESDRKDVRVALADRLKEGDQAALVLAPHGQGGLHAQRVAEFLAPVQDGPTSVGQQVQGVPGEHQAQHQTGDSKSEAEHECPRSAALIAHGKQRFVGRL